MNASSPLTSTLESEPRAAIARLVRRVYLLREQGDAVGAQQLQQVDLGNAVRDFRLAHGPEALSENELLAMHVREEQRIADAVVLAEILIPQLVPRPGGAAVGIAPNAPTPLPAPPLPPPPPPSAPASARPAATGSPGIPDLLDAMLAAERSQRRAPAASRH